MSQSPPANRFKHGLAALTPQIGFWLNFASANVTEVCAQAGFDWLLIDMEHSANDLPEVVDHLRALEGGTAEPVVRVPWNEPVLVKRLMDQGARSFLFPFVQSAGAPRGVIHALSAEGHPRLRRNDACQPLRARA